MGAGVNWSALLADALAGTRSAARSTKRAPCGRSDGRPVVSAGRTPSSPARRPGNCEGDSASFLINADSLYEKVFHSARPAYIHKGEKLRFEIRINKIETPANSQTIKSNVNPVSAKAEDLDIRQYLAENNLMVEARPNGMVYISFLEGKGKRPMQGDSVEIEYTGNFLSGEMFDATNKRTGPLKYKMGDGTMLESWEEGISLMKEGGRARIVLPSRLAYGTNEFGPIKPNSTIIYDVLLKNVY